MLLTPTLCNILLKIQIHKYGLNKVYIIFFIFIYALSYVSYDKEYTLVLLCGKIPL